MEVLRGGNPLLTPVERDYMGRDPPPLWAGTRRPSGPAPVPPFRDRARNLSGMLASPGPPSALGPARLAAALPACRRLRGQSGGGDKAARRRFCPLALRGRLLARRCGPGRPPPVAAAAALAPVPGGLGSPGPSAQGSGVWLRPAGALRAAPLARSGLAAPLLRPRRVPLARLARRLPLPRRRCRRRSCRHWARCGGPNGPPWPSLLPPAGLRPPCGGPFSPRPCLLFYCPFLYMTFTPPGACGPCPR